MHCAHAAFQQVFNDVRVSLQQLRQFFPSAAYNLVVFLTAWQRFLQNLGMYLQGSLGSR